MSFSGDGSSSACSLCSHVVSSFDHFVVVGFV
jgi:hypothetical protein